MAHLLVGRYLLANEPLFLCFTPNKSSGKLPPPTKTSFRLGLTPRGSHHFNGNIGGKPATTVVLA